MPKSWESEHDEVKRLATKLSPGDRWRFGFLQVHHDEKLPATRFPEGGVAEFLVPEQKLSLKLYFDNLRNYAICAAFGALGAWVSNVPAPSRLLGAWPGIRMSFAVMVWVVSAGFLLLNIAQTWILVREAAGSFWKIHAARFYLYRPETIPQAVLALGHLAYHLVAGLAFWLLATVLSLTLVGISIVFVVYTILLRNGGV